MICSFLHPLCTWHICSHPHFFKLSVVRILLRSINHANTLNFGRTFNFLNALIWVEILGPSFIVKYADLTVQAPLPFLFQINSSWSCHEFSWRSQVMREMNAENSSEPWVMSEVWTIVPMTLYCAHLPLLLSDLVKKKIIPEFNISLIPFSNHALRMK